MEKRRNKEIDELVNETELLVNTLGKLKKEIESYDTATQNLEETRKDLGEFTTSIEDLSKKQLSLNRDFHDLIKRQLIKKIDTIIAKQEENEKNNKKNFNLVFISIAGIAVLQVVSMII